MSFPNPFNTAYWVEYEPPSNVIRLNTPHARAHAIANARQAAVAVEDDRVAVRKDEIIAQLEELYAERERMNVRIVDLENSLEELRRG